MSNAVYEYVEKNWPQYQEDLFRIVSYPSISPIPGYEQQIHDCAEAVADLMRKYGLKAELYGPWGKGSPVVYGETPKIPGAPTIFVYGHYDVQPPGDLSGWNSDPFQPVIRDGRVYARGIGDNKCQVLSYLFGYDACCKTIGQPKVNICFAVEGEEESGSVQVAEFIRRYKDTLLKDCEITLWSDSSQHPSGQPILYLCCKGVVSIHMTAHGPAQDVHSMWGSVMPSPVWKLVRILDALVDENGRAKIPGFYDDYVGPDEEEKAAIRKIPGDLAAYARMWQSPDFDASMDPEEFYLHYMYDTVMNIGCIHAGSVEGAKNIVPSKAEVWIDLRLGKNADYETKKKQFADYVSSLGYPGIELEMHGIPSAYTSIHNPYVALVRQAAEEVWQKEPLIYPGQGGSGPFYLFNDILNAPCILTPIADASQHDHGLNESVPVDSIQKGIKMTARIYEMISSR